MEKKYLVEVKFLDGTSEIAKFETNPKRNAFIETLKTTCKNYIESYKIREEL